MTIDRLDHIVLTVRDVDASCDFYTRVLGMEVVTFAGGRRALTFGQQKINLHSADAPVAPHAMHPTPGSADLCLITMSSMNEVLAHLEEQGVFVTEGRFLGRGPWGRSRRFISGIRI